MGTKEDVLRCLESHKGSFVSGSKLAQSLFLSRNAIWRAIKALEEEGYAIEAKTRLGYRLKEDCSILSAAKIESHLHAKGVVVEYHDVVDSTNVRAKLLASQGCPEGTLVVANQQTAGQGRQGRPFFSPAGSGIYFSLVLRPDFALEDIALITSYGATCAAQAIDQVFGVATQIKWVNDVFLEGHKVCGILTEASIRPETAEVDSVIVGIGINVATPEEGFPGEVQGIAQSICEGKVSDELRAQVVARTVDLFFQDYQNLSRRPHLKAYREKSLLDGMTVQVFQGKKRFDATVVGINDDFTLEVKLTDGTQTSLVHGEVRIPSSQLGQGA